MVTHKVCTMDSIYSFFLFFFTQAKKDTWSVSGLHHIGKNLPKPQTSIFAAEFLIEMRWCDEWRFTEGAFRAGPTLVLLQW